jgi:hypothetical protein
MPTGPKGENRPADIIGNAVKVMRIATGEEAQDCGASPKNETAAELGRIGGHKRAEKMSDEDKSKSAKKAAKARWAARAAPSSEE